MPTDFADANKRITDLFKDNIGTNVDAVEYENYQEGEGALDNSNVEKWARLTIQPGTSLQASFSDASQNRQWRHIGLVTVQIFVRRGIWTKTVNDIADAVAAIYRGVTDNGVIYGAVSITTVGATGGWFQVNVTVPYRWDQFT